MRHTFLQEKRRLKLRHKISLARGGGDSNVLEFDCHHTEVLPGELIIDPASSSDVDAVRCDRTTRDLLSFYKDVFGRAGIDGLGGEVHSCIHYGTSYVNAAWDSQEMVYGDGDGVFFLSFTRSNDFIGHELTHGVTEHSAALEYHDESGALNESVSDVFGSMFRQWIFNQKAKDADWKIGTDIMGPVPLSRGWICVRDLSDPQSRGSATQQPSSYKNYVPQGDMHINSGIGNHAFYLAASNFGGCSWECIGKVWYGALTSPSATPQMTYRDFALLCVHTASDLFSNQPEVAHACRSAWQSVDVL
jgi:Zn-dependent metalloprotease